MGSSDDVDPDDRLLDELYERAVADAQADSALDLDAWLVGREHLRARAQAVVAEGRELALFAPRRAATARPGVIPGHTVLGEVGHGGMGTVFRARQESLGRIVALKVLSPALRLSPRARARFQLEARALSRLRHPNVVAVYEVLPDSDVCAYTMEWIDGVTLAAQTAAVGQPRDVRAIAVLGETLARALAAVHVAGLVHRDVKPSNVVLRDDGAPVLIDFGLVRDLDQGQATESGEFLGTAAFAAPEQLRGAHARVGPWTDVYGLGVTLYNSLAGRTPYSTTSTLALLHDIENGLGEPLSRVAPGVPRDLAVIVTKAIAPEPERRYATATELADDLSRYLAGRPILARPASTVERGARWVRRNPWPTAALVILAVGLAATGRLAHVAAVRAADNEDLAFANAASARAEADARRAATESATAASARAAELERVLAFREGQWASVDSEALGQGLRAALLARARGGDREALTTGLTGVNLTDVALDVLRVQLFDRERAAIATGFTGEPLVAARLLQGLADPLRALGLLDAALGPQREALELRRGYLGAKHVDTLASAQALGALLLARGELAEAELLLADTLEHALATLGEAHPLTLSTRRTHAAVIHALGRLSEAEPLFAQAALAHEAHLGVDHPDTLSVVVQHAALLEEQGRAVDAHARLAPAIERLEAIARPEDPATLVALETLATIYASLGQNVEAERLRVRVVETRSRSLGDDHHETIRATRLLAKDYLALGRFVEAHARLLELCERCSRVLDPAHPETIATLVQLAGVTPDGFDHSRMLPALELAIEQARTVHSDEHDATLRARGARAMALVLCDRRADGIAEMREVLAISRRVFGNDDDGTLERIELLVSMLDSMRGAREAESLARELVAERRRLHGPEHPRTLFAERALGSVLLWHSELAEAEELVRHAGEGLRATLGPEHHETLSTYEGLGSVLRLRGDFAASELVLREVLDARLRGRGEQSLSTASARYELASLLKELGREDEAIELVERVLEVRRRILGSEHDYTLQAVFLLGGAESSRGRLDVAAKYQYEALEALRRRPRDDSDLLNSAANGLCVTLLRLGRSYEAIPYCREALELVEKALAPDHRRTLSIRGNLASALSKIGDLAEAEALYRDVLARQTETLGRLNTDTASSHYNLGFLLAKTQRFVEAEFHLVAALDIYLATLDPTHRSTVLARAKLGEVLLLQDGRHAEALAVLAPGEDAARVHFVGSSWRDLTLYLYNLGRAHCGPDANRDWPTAESYLLEAYSLCEANPAANTFERRFATQYVSDMYDAWHEAEPSEERARLRDAWRARLAAFDSQPAPTAGPSEPK